MIRVSLGNIQDFGLPLDTTEKIIKRGESGRILRKLEKQYNVKSTYECRKGNQTYMFYEDVSNNYIPHKVRKMWIDNYEIYVRSSIQYKFWILTYKVQNFLKSV